jgi:hypothetical protein
MGIEGDEEYLITELWLKTHKMQSAARGAKLDMNNI